MKLTGLIPLVTVLCSLALRAQAELPPEPRAVIVNIVSSTPAPSCYYCWYSYPAQVTLWQDPQGQLHTSGWFYSAPRAMNIPLSWTPRQTVWVESADGSAAWYVLQWANPGWVWTHPDDVNLRPFYQTIATGGYPFSFLTYNIPVGRRFPAHAITTSPAGTCAGCDDTPVTFETKFAQLGGSTNTKRYQAREYPLVFGSCVSSDQSSGAPGDFYGFWGYTPPFQGVSYTDWQTGTFVIGPNPYGPEADFNMDLAVTTQDIFDFVTSYLTGDPRSDLDHSGVCDTADLFRFLASWFDTAH